MREEGARVGRKWNRIIQQDKKDNQREEKKKYK